MADDIQGGLNAVNQPMEETPIIEEAPAVKESSKETVYKETSLDKLKRQQLIYDQTLQKMIDSLGARQGRPTLDRELAALGAELSEAPYFASGFSKGVAKMADVRALDEQRKLEQQKMQADLLGSQIGITKEQYALEKEFRDDEIRKKIYENRLGKGTQDKLAVGADGKPNISALMSSTSQPTDRVLTLDFIAAQPKSMQKELLDLYKIQQEDLKASAEKAKPTEFNVPFKGLVKGTIAQYEGIERLRTHPWYQSLSDEERMKAMQVAMAELGIGEEQPIPKSVSDTTKISDGQKPPTIETTSQKEQRKLLEGKAGEKIIEADQEERKYVKGLRDNSNGIIQSADILYNLASNPKTKEAFGVLQKGGVVNALLGLAEEGIGGEALSIRIKGIEDAARKLKYTDSEGKPINPNDLINAVRVANQQIGKLSLSFAQIYLKGQGAVSDFERKLVEDTIPNTKDPATSMMLKAELLKARAMFDRDMGRAAMSYINKDPLHRTIEQYKATDEYRGFVDKLDSASRGIMQTYFPDANVAPQSKPSSAPTGNYADIVKQEKERRSLR
jgi:hypothetical protein